MKALSILQPWASLIVRGHKRVETRSFNTKHRGLLLIHASAGFGPDQRMLAQGWALAGYLPDYAGRKKSFSTLPFGAIIGAVELVDTQFAETLLPELSQLEKDFGDYSAGRYGWMLNSPVAFKEPIPCKGRLMLWEPDPATMELVNQAISEL